MRHRCARQAPAPSSKERRPGIGRSLSRHVSDQARQPACRHLPPSTVPNSVAAMRHGRKPPGTFPCSALRRSPVSGAKPGPPQRNSANRLETPTGGARCQPVPGSPDEVGRWPQEGDASSLLPRPCRSSPPCSRPARPRRSRRGLRSTPPAHRPTPTTSPWSRVTWSTLRDAFRREADRGRRQPRPGATDRLPHDPAARRRPVRPARRGAAADRHQGIDAAAVQHLPTRSRWATTTPSTDEVPMIATLPAEPWTCRHRRRPPRGSKVDSSTAQRLGRGAR